MATDKNIAFLFGAGISIPAQIPSTDDLTIIVLEGNIGKDLSRYGETTDPSQFSWNPQNEYVNRIRKLFFLIKEHLGSHYSFINKNINYEDYYYIIDSIHEDEDMNFENPAVTFFSEYLLKDHSYLFEPLDEQHSKIRLIDLCSNAKDLIKDIVTFRLDKPPSTLNHLHFLLDVFKEDSINNKYIFTLNHDTIIEQFFEHNNITYSDGFKPFDDSMRIWDKDFFNEKISFLKLHGSVNWYRDSGMDWYDDHICIYNEVPRGADRPLIQIGSFNKIHQYNRGVYFQLQCLFAKYLEAVDTIVISGYSFGDPGVNNRILDWFYNNRDNKIIVIHKNSNSLKTKARLAISGKWDKWLKSKSLIIIPKYIEDVTWDDINSNL